MTDSKLTRKTPEELQAENDKLLEELTPEITEEVKEEEKKPAEIQALSEEREIIQEEIEKEEMEKSEDAEKEVEEATPSPDYKKKFSEEARQNQKIYAKNRKLIQSIDEANEISEPTEEELRSEYEDWDLLDETTKRLAKESFLSTKRFALISKARAESKRIEKWDEDVAKFADDPQTLIDNPELEGKLDEFKVFANEETNNSVPFKILVNSFLYEQSKIAKPKSKGAMFPDGSGGPNDKPKSKSDRISVEESEVLRQTNYNEYKKLLKEGKIETSL